MKFPFFGKSQPPAKTKSVCIDIPQGSLVALSLSGGNISATEAFRLYGQSSAVATSVDMIGDSFRQITPVIQVGESELLTDHPVLSLLRNPNDFQTWEMFAERISKNFLISGNSHISNIGNLSRLPIELYSVKASNITTTPAEDLHPLEYGVLQGRGYGNYRRDPVPGGNRMRFTDGQLKELTHIMGYSSGVAEVSGDSPLKAIALEVNQQIKGRVHNLKLLENGGRMSMLVTFKDSMTPEQHTERRELIREQMGGASNAGSIGVISSEDMKVDEFGKSNKDMDYAELDKVAAMATYMRYRIPLPLITVDATSFNNYTKAVESLYDFAVLPHADFIFAGLSMALLPRFGIDPSKVRITYNPDSITALMDRRLEQLRKRKEVGVETPNEYRSLLPNRGDIEGGDILLVKANEIPVTEAGKIVSGTPRESESKESEKSVY